MEEAKRRAIEALRAGVPNRSAVKQLGTDQTAIETQFLNALAEVPHERRLGRQLPGFLIEGGYGSGKSHLLRWLEHIALEQGFACSTVVISKETPLSDPHKVFRSAVDALTLPDRIGGLPAVADRLTFDTPSCADFFKRVEDPQAGFDPLFQATLLVYERLRTDNETQRRIVGFWGGDRLSVRDVKGWLRQVGEARPELRARPIKELALPRFRFAAELIAAAGYTGWVLLLDELELVANLSLTARAHSYAVLAALAGRLEQRPIPGMLVAGAATDDFTEVVFDGRRDHEKIPQRWSERDPAFLVDVEAGIGLLQPGGWLLIRAPRPDALARTHERVRAIYSDAYDWRPPEERVEGDSQSMRQHVRRWITSWDLRRLDPSYDPEIEIESVEHDWTEDPNLERQDAEDKETTDELT
jgi:P-loop Domain of unknown function (DUF2791)